MKLKSVEEYKHSDMVIILRKLWSSSSFNVKSIDGNFGKLCQVICVTGLRM